jgi:hypothetical protein
MISVASPIGIRTFGIVNSILQETALMVESLLVGARESRRSIQEFSMKRHLLAFAVVVAMIAIAALAFQKKPGLLLMDWAARGQPQEPGAAILIEFGLKDEKSTSWTGHATVTGAKVVHREGFRFRDKDKLMEPNGWEVSSRFPVDPASRPALTRLMRPATVGVVLHLADIEPGTTLTVEAEDKATPKVSIPLQEILAGQPKKIWDGKAILRRVSKSSPVVTAKTEDDFPAAAYAPDGTLWLAYISYTLKEERRRTSLMSIDQQPADFRSYYTPEFGDQLFVKYFRNGKWSDPTAVTEPTEDLARCAIGVQGDGKAWVVYSAHRQSNFDLYARTVTLAPNNGHGQAAALGQEKQLTRNSGPVLGPVMCTDQSGNPWLACQSWSKEGTGRVALFNCRGDQWREISLPDSAGHQNQWYPALAAGPDGRVALAFDVYRDGDYDVQVAVLPPASAAEQVALHPVATSAKFEARPSIVYDPQGRLWIAYEEGPEKWGKDYGALDANDGSPLYNVRSVRVACLEGDKLLAPAAELPTSKPIGQAQFNLQTPRYAYPKLGLDGNGRIWLTYRLKLPTPFGVQPGTDWITQARRLDGDHWTEPMDIHHSDGLLDSRPVLLPDGRSGLLVITNTDCRHATPGVIDNQIYAAVVDRPGNPVEPKLVPKEPGTKDRARAVAEDAAVKRIRDYRVQAEGKSYRLFRGEFHRHTEISFDGGGDGSLEDMYRYAIDAAALDWIGNTDHDSGGGREYSWWLIQKSTDAYHVGQAFTPIFSYERSCQYPHGHRNCIFARRGIRTLPRLAEPDRDKRVAGIHADDAKMLFRYLRELDGICASHTSATNMGTDWRDNDPVVEPVVEIYQGDRNSYEYQEAPRAGHDPKSNKLPASIGGWQPAGFLDNALKDKGYRLGFQASSDHISTHISYCIALAERADREAIAAALKKRRCYAATDDIILDVRSGKHLMGEEFKTNAPPSLKITAIGTQPLAQVDIIKDSKVVHTVKPGKAEYQGEWTDPEPNAGVHYYYVRVQQADEELAWGSPLWIDYAK